MCIEPSLSPGYRVDTPPLSLSLPGQQGDVTGRETKVLPLGSVSPWLNLHRVLNAYWNMPGVFASSAVHLPLQQVGLAACSLLVTLPQSPRGKGSLPCLNH